MSGASSSFIFSRSLFSRKQVCPRKSQKFAPNENFPLRYLTAAFIRLRASDYVATIQGRRLFVYNVQGRHEPVRLWPYQFLREKKWRRLDFNLRACAWRNVMVRWVARFVCVADSYHSLNSVLCAEHFYYVSCLYVTFPACVVVFDLYMYAIVLHVGRYR